MRKKVLFLVTCCLVVCLALGGCAKDEPPLEAPAEADASPGMPAEPEEKPAEELPEEDLDEFLAKIAAMTNEELDALLGDDSLTDAEFDAVVAEIDARRDAKVETDAKLHGIIALKFQFDIDTGINQYIVYQIDPGTGQSTEVRHFTTSSRPLNDTNYAVFNREIESRNSKRHWFFDDYTKLLASKEFKDTQDVHAGWIDENGNFFDVNEAVGDVRNNAFEDPIRNKALGFTRDGKFVYFIGGHGNGYFCEIMSSSDSYSCNPPIKGTIERYTVSYEWLDNNHYIDCSDKPKIYDVTASDFNPGVDLLPESGRTNWSAILSPDKEYVAFPSCSSPDQTTAEIFIMPLNNPNNIRKLETDIGFSGYPMYDSLLEWRE